MRHVGSYRDLDVYRRAHDAAVRIHGATMRLPKYELYEAGGQLRRAAKSVAANIVEGYGRRRYKADFVPFLVYAHASCDEAAEWLRLSRDCHDDFAELATELLAEVEEVGRMLHGFIQSVESGHRTKRDRQNCPQRPHLPLASRILHLASRILPSASRQAPTNIQTYTKGSSFWPNTLS